MNDRILLIGATGTTGMALARELHARGLGFRAMVRDPAAATPLQGLGAELVAGDLADPDRIAAACAGVDRIYLAHAVHPKLRDWCANVYAAATAAGVRHILRLSAMCADPNSEIRLLQLHGLADADLRASGLDWTILRPNAFMQNLLAQAPVIAGSGSFYLPAGASRQSLIDARDVADAAAAILDGTQATRGEIYTLTGPESISYHEVAVMISDALGTPVSYVPVSEEDSCQALLGAGLAEWNAQVIAELQAEFATGDFSRITKNVRTLTGTPGRRLVDFIAEYIDAFRGS